MQIPTPPRPQTHRPSSFRVPPHLADLQKQLTAMIESERMTQLVDYLDDLRKEFDWAAAELKAMGFCAPCYFSEQDDDDDHDCVEAD